MAYSITIIVLVINLFLVIIKKNNKLIGFGSFIWLFILFYGNNANPDYSGYLWRYNTQTYYSSMEIGYKFLSQWSHLMGLDYQQFVLLLIAITIPIIIVILKKEKTNINLFVVLYTIAIFTMDVIQIRNYVACIFFSLAIIMLMEGRKWEYVLLIAIASLFHITMVLYIPFVLLSDKTHLSEKFTKLIFGLTIALCGIAIFSRNVILKPITSIVTMVIGESEKINYFGNYINFGFLLFFMAGLSNIILIKILKDIVGCYEYKDIFEEKYFSGIQTLYIFNMLTCVFFPLVMLNYNFIRLIRNNCIILIVVTGAVINQERTYKNLLLDYGLRETDNVSNHRRILYQYLVVAIVFFTVIWFVTNGINRYCPDILENNFILHLGG